MRINQKTMVQYLICEQRFIGKEKLALYITYQDQESVCKVEINILYLYFRNER